MTRLGDQRSPPRKVPTLRTGSAGTRYARLETKAEWLQPSVPRFQNANPLVQWRVGRRRLLLHQPKRLLRVLRVSEEDLGVCRHVFDEFEKQPLSFEHLAQVG